MNNARTLAFVAIACMALFASGENALQAQGFFDKLIDKTVDKTTEKVTEDVSESASDKAAEESNDAVEGLLDGIFGGSSSSGNAAGGNSDAGDATGGDLGGGVATGGDVSGGTAAQNGLTEEQMAMMQQMMGGMDKSADVPAEYRFDLVLHVEIRESGEDTEELKLMVAKDGTQFGVDMEDDGSGNRQTSVIDSKNQLMAVFTVDAKGNKTAMALPNMMEMGAQYGQGQMENAQEEFEAFNFGPTGQYKMVAGYRCAEYKGEDETTVATFYMTKELPADWMEAFMSGFGANAPTAYFHPYGDLQGTLLESHAVDKKSGETTSWVTTKVDQGGSTIRKADYTFGMGGME